MAQIRKRKGTWRGWQGSQPVVCCGRACDDRCWQLAVRERHLDRRVSTASVLRVV